MKSENEPIKASPAAPCVRTRTGHDAVDAKCARLGPACRRYTGVKICVKSPVGPSRYMLHAVCHSHELERVGTSSSWPVRQDNV